MDGSSSAAVAEALKKKGMLPLAVNRVGGDTNAPLTHAKVKVAPLSQFCKQLATVLRAGVPISTALEILSQQIEDQNLKTIIDDVYTKILSGKSLYEAFYVYRENFPSMFFNMVEAGEQSGRIDECLDRAADTFLRQAKLNGRIKAALVYPIVLIVLTVAVTMVLMIFVVPQFTALFKENDAELPFLTKILVAASDFIIKSWYFIIIVVAGIVVGIRVFLANPNGRMWWDRNKLHLPMVGMRLSKIATARFARTLITLITAGIPLTNALEVAGRSINNVHMEEKVFDVIENVRMGQTMSSQIARTQVFPTLLSNMMRLGEESGEIEPLLDTTADFYETEAENAIQGLMSMMEPALILVLGCVILPIILGIIMPTFNLWKAIK